MFDDSLLKWGDTAGTLDAWKALGVERVRTNLLWKDVAPSPASTRKPPGFEGWRHTASGYDWSLHDRIVSGARSRGLRVHVTISGPGPVWASHSPRRRNGAWKPSTLEFARFAQAVATRYRRQVDRYSIYNEPNQGGWLQPQSRCGRRGCRLYSPHYYRRLYRAAYPRIRGKDRTARILLGELAPSGRDRRGATRPVRPLTFLREMACRNHRYRPKRRGECRHFTPVRAHGVAHHPYPVRKKPGARSPHRSDAALGDTRRLLRVLDRLQRRRGIRKLGRGRFSVWYTEFGYQTHPPDPFSGISLARQSIWMGWSQYLMWRQPRVRGWTQYVYRDDPPRPVAGRKRWGGWQAGLYTHTGGPKRYARSFAAPFWVSDRSVRRSGRVRLWGQYKPGGRHTVRLQYHRGGRWRTLKRIRTNSRGYWSHKRRMSRSLSWRFAHPGGATRKIRVRVGR